MNPFLFLATFLHSFGDVVSDSIFGFLDWLKMNDFSGTRRRKKRLAEAPEAFESDGLPVVLDADDHGTLIYREGGFILKSRKNRSTEPVSRTALRRFARRGMKGLRSQLLKLNR